MILLAALAATQLVLPACVLKKPGITESVHGQWVRESSYILADVNDLTWFRPKHASIGGRDYFIAYGGERGEILDIGYKDEEGEHQTQTLAIGPGEIVSFVCVEAGDA